MRKILLMLALASASSITLADSNSVAPLTGSSIYKAPAGSSTYNAPVPQTRVAHEYVELGKLYSLHPDLASNVIDVNIGTAIKCGKTLTWQDLFDDYGFRNYSSLTRNAPNENNTKALDALVESLCLSLSLTTPRDSFPLTPIKE